MGVDKENRRSHHDLVEQLLEERRQRLQIKLNELGDFGGDDAFSQQVANEIVKKSPVGGASTWRAPLREVQNAWEPLEVQNAWEPLERPNSSGAWAVPRGRDGNIELGGVDTGAPKVCYSNSAGKLHMPPRSPPKAAPAADVPDSAGSSATTEGAAAERPRSALQGRRKEKVVAGDLLSTARATAEPAPQPQRGFGARQREWSQRQRAFQERQQRARQEKEERELQHCTFRPAISSKSVAYARRARGCSVEPLAERLYHEADKRTAWREKAKELVEADEVGAHTFSPSVNSSQLSKGSHYIPIQKRVELIQKRKQDRLRAAQAEEEKLLEGAFHPEISTRSRKIVEQKQTKLQRSMSDGQIGRALDCPVEERLYRDAQLQEQRRAECLDSLSQVSGSVPCVDEGSRRICRSSVYFQGEQQDFLTRQRTFEAARQRRQDIRNQHAETECSFAPNICVSSRQLIATKLDFLRSSPSETTERLAVKDVDRRGQRQRDATQTPRQDCTFRPSVSVASQQMAAAASSSGTSAHERLYRAAVEGRARDSSQTEADECTFRPQVSPESAKKFAHVKGHYSGSGSAVMKNVQEELDRRSENLADRRRQLEEREMQECTFVPVARGAFFEDRCAPVPVSGLDRFFELRNLALKQKEGQKLREEQVMRPDLSDARCLGVTVPAPFDLTGRLQASEASHQLSV